MKKVLLPIFVLVVALTSGCSTISKQDIWWGYFVYEGKIYLNTTWLEISWADIHSFKFLFKQTDKDWPQTFAKDKNAVYWESRVLFTGFDYDSLTWVVWSNRGEFKDKNATYSRSWCDEKWCIYTRELISK